MIKLQEMVVPEGKDKNIMAIETGKGMKQYTVGTKALGLAMGRVRMFSANYPIIEPSTLAPETFCPDPNLDADPTQPQPNPTAGAAGTAGACVRNGWKRNGEGEVVRTNVNLLLFGKDWEENDEFFELQSDDGVLPTIKATKQPDMWTTSRDQNKPRRMIRIEEGERLFGLEPGHTAAPGLGDTARWARLGEAVVVDVLEYVLRPVVAKWAKGQLENFLFDST